MFRFIILFLLGLISNFTFSQENVSWSFLYDISNESIVIEADIAEGWHLYSQNIDQNVGPVPTTFEFIENSAINIVGKTTEPQSITKFDENFGGELSFFEGKVIFNQKIKVLNSAIQKGIITYMICNDEICLPPKEVEFEVVIDK